MGESWIGGARKVPKTICDVAASMLTAACGMLKNGAFYDDLGAGWVPHPRRPERSRRICIFHLRLGWDGMHS